ncbi:MAG: Asp-tRNA(Asn)/Glu-tRNA(Gln) amidotransferase subunit GatA [Thermoguttaceae bacterium]
MSSFSAMQWVRQLTAGKATSVDVTQEYLDRIKQRDPNVQAFLRVDPSAALVQAEAIDRRRKAGEPTTCASRMLEHFRSPYDATVVAKLKAADAVLIGRTNMDEFAMGGSNENSAFFPTRNPWDPSRVPGGSSGGSAAAVAARMAPLAVGSDTGGSIRCPAALCGVTGLKPTYGRVSRFGLVAFASSLDQIGPMGQTAEDCALLLEVIAGHDPKDSTSIDQPVPRYTQSISQSLNGLRLGVVREHFGEGLDPEVDRAVREAIRVYQSLGATVHEVSMPHAKYAVATYYIIAPCEASSNLARYDGVHFGYRSERKEERAEAAAKTGSYHAGSSPLVDMYCHSRSEGFGDEVKRRIMLGTYALSAGYYDAYYKKALQVRRLIRQDFDRAFGQVDLLVGPVTPTPAFKLGERIDDPLAMYLFDLYTVSANLAGIAGMSIPCGFSSEGLPIGLQLQAPPLAEECLLRGAAMFQRATDWHTKEPDLD